MAVNKSLKSLEWFWINRIKMTELAGTSVMFLTAPGQLVTYDGEKKLNNVFRVLDFTVHSHE